MKYVRFLAIGILFGIVMTKSEVISWYRIQEMFRFDSFHMYGVIGTAVVVGAIIVALIKRTRLHAINGEAITVKEKSPGIVRYLAGGTLFGLGWALTGACPGPLYVLLGHGYGVILLALLSAMLGTFTYGLLRPRLPH